MFAFFQRKTPPKVIYLKGEPRRDGLDVREKPEDPVQLLQLLAPAPIRLRVPLEVNTEVLEWLWLERGYQMPGVVIEPAAHFSLTVLDQAETFHDLEHPFFTPPEVVQLRLARAVVTTLPRFLHRDYVMAQAQNAGVNLDPRLLSRLSKYLRKLLQAGWTLPPPEQWTELANSVPFDEIASGCESLRLRQPLDGPRRTQLIFQALTEGTSTPETFQAIEEFWVASAQVFPEFSKDPKVLQRDLLRNPRLELESWARQRPDFEERILQAEHLPAPTLPRLARLAVLAQDLRPEQRLELEWPLPQLLATPTQERLARQRLGPQ